ncbi:DUF2207 domain-containing protein [Leucobacter sp. W1478]|uniref:DUF2207 domain-containing protein n=1 Tax=Leucobacter sp. W1478 TaxID=3439065 RepID=UPI003F2B7786
MMRLLLLITALLATLGVALGATPAHANVDDFEYDSWHVSYQLDVDEDGRAVARVTEQLVAVFPDFDQNRGIVRALPLSYERADAAPRDIAISDAAGKPVPFEVEDDDTFRIILVGDDSFVRGVQTYVISYTLHDVVLATDDRDEFYWDVVPIERQQPIAAFSAEFSIAEGLGEKLTGATACFTGSAYSTDTCEISEASPQSGSAMLTVEPFALPAGSGVTVGIAFENGSVVQPPVRLPNPFLDIVPVVSASAALLLGLVSAVLIVLERRKRRTYRGVIVAQYEVPDNLPPLIAGPVSGENKSTIAAQVVHLAVRGALRIEDGTEPAGFLGKGRPQPVLRLLDQGRAVDGLDRRTISDLFGSAGAGATFTLPKKDEKFGKKMVALSGEGVTQATKRGYFEQIRSRTATILGAAALALGALAVILTFIGIARENWVTITVSLPFGFAAIVLGIVGMVKHRVHTQRGAEAREHLAGVREFIRVAESDRLRLLQGHTTAERRPDGSVDVVVLYERLLPYAILFGLEKEWGKVLEVQYQETGVDSPLWYPALGVYGLTHLDRSISSFSQSFTSAVSYSSSSSGGTSGGGFSGGGGGGGFSGGR